jgi:hypothetical protein
MKYEQGLREEFNKFCDSYIKSAETEWCKTDNPVDLTSATVAKIMQNKFNNLFPEHPSPVKESLAELADRKGFRGVVYDQTNDGASAGKRYYCSPYKSHPDGGNDYFVGHTYSEAEQSAREYLEGLEDKI